ncbi:patatin-like phospholipase family protein [Cupriavidus sp. RAF20_2]|uniref:patatin-like phospholipase family protein n=1 Tax=Cupriavidus sp. RAF20_2 TaxID=3233053 RepID=UPI003F8E7E23
MAGQHRFRTAAVFGGGGVAGIAWEVGVLAGLARAGVAVHRAGLFVGTSAGSVVGAQLACGLHIEALLHAQLHPPADSPEQFRPYSQAEADAQNRKLVAKVEGDLTAARQRIGDFARRSETPAPAARRAIIAARLPQADWPGHPLRMAAVDAATGARRVFDAASGVPLVEAVSASCAVPGVWPPVQIGDAFYIDGGIASMTNAEVAIDAERVLVLSPFGYAEGNPVSGHLGAEVAALQAAGCAVHVVAPSPAALEAMGPNVLDPARRPASAAAGLHQGDTLAYAIRDWWGAAIAA